MQLFSHHLLSVVLFTPTIGALVLLFIPRGAQTLHRLMGNLFGVLGFVVSLPLVLHFPVGYQGYTFTESADWIPSIGARYSLGLDGISLLLVMLTTLLGMIAILSSWSAIQTRTKEFYILLAASADRNAGRLHVPGFLPLLRFLGSHAGAHVFPNRRLGQRPPSLRRHQILFVHSRRFRADAARHPGAVLQCVKGSAVSRRSTFPHCSPPRSIFRTP